jgi:hypothetical protein
MSWSWLSDLGRSGAVMQALFIRTSGLLKDVFSFAIPRMICWRETAQLALLKEFSTAIFEIIFTFISTLPLGSPSYFDMTFWTMRQFLVQMPHVLAQL